MHNRTTYKTHGAKSRPLHVCGPLSTLISMYQRSVHTRVHSHLIGRFFVCSFLAPLIVTVVVACIYQNHDPISIVCEDSYPFPASHCGCKVALLLPIGADCWYAMGMNVCAYRMGFLFWSNHQKELPVRGPNRAPKKERPKANTQCFPYIYIYIYPM